MAIWAILAAPLLMSTDLKNIRPEFHEILINQQIIAVNQDKLGIQGTRIQKERNIEVFTTFCSRKNIKLIIFIEYFYRHGFGQSHQSSVDHIHMLLHGQANEMMVLHMQ